MTNQGNQFKSVITYFKSFITEYKDRKYKFAYTNIGQQLLDDLYLIACLLFGISGFVLFISGVTSAITYLTLTGIVKSVLGSAFIICSSKMSKGFRNNRF